ncbi:MAG: sensor diguanylate cyclase/phosphodiesterase, partial [Deltaproteobacteria bacterium]|nr:sensor diguanylate cyclase/phosphodiesterase [Deltaproteobacteria bacterium]
MDFSRLKYISTDAPTTDELELLNKSRIRISQVIRARWIILGILAAYGVIPYVIFDYYSIDLSPVTTLQVVFPVLAWCAMATYNAFFLYSHQWFVNIRPLNQVQLLLDLLFVTVVIHFSGGAVSWFWPMYLVVTLESVLVMERDSDTFAFALGASLAYGGLLQFEFYGIIPPVSMPFENLSLQQTLPYEVMKWAWVTMTNLSVAAIGVYLMKTIRHREEELKKLVIKDNLTSLYNRAYFFYRLNSEIQRAKRYNRSLSLLIMDMDNFKHFNDRYGHLVGDELLRVLSGTIRSNIRYSTGKPSYELDIPCRYGGDEFAIILPETTSAQATVAAERLRKEINVKCGHEMMAQIHAATGSHPMEVPDVTISIGVASFPEHGLNTEALVKAADDAMYAAKRSEKDHVVAAGTSSSLFPVTNV